MFNKAIQLHKWAIDRTENYPNVHNFEPYDLAICALLDSFVPDKINYMSLNPANRQENMELAKKVMEELNVPVLIYPEDLTDGIDKKSVLTQLSEVKTHLQSFH